MIDDYSSIMLFKFGKTKFMKQIKNGCLSFGTIGSYIDIARRTGNDEQGDINEAVFARIKKDDPRVDKMKKKLGFDLEVINDGEYVKLRRKSSYLIPCFCFYSYKAIDALNRAEEREGNQTVTHHFDERIFTSFVESKSIKHVLSNDEQYAQLIIQPQPFKYAVVAALDKENISGHIRYIDYEKFASEEFFIEPTELREELFFKHPKYSYQNEARICLINKRAVHIYDRFDLHLEPFIKDNIELINCESYFDINISIGKI